jgi:hypothetical protein
MKQSICSSSSSSQRGTSLVVRLAILASLLLGIGSPLAIHAQADQAAEPHTEAAVIADSESWSKAEAGDVVYVDHLLLPEYRSVNVDGSVYPKDAILGGVRKRANSPALAAAYTADSAKYKAAHPYTTTAVISGDTAILTYSPAIPDSSKPVRSCDIFVYREGHWRAIYSQHTEAAGK